MAITRRQFLKRTAVTAGALLGSSLFEHPFVRRALASTLVAVCRNSGATSPEMHTPGTSLPLYWPGMAMCRPIQPVPAYAPSPSGFAVRQMVFDSSCERL